MNTSKLNLIIVIVLLFVLSGCSPGALSTSDAWVRPASAGQNSALYFVLSNDSSKDDVLRGVEGDIAASFETHETMIDTNNVASMHHMMAIEVPANSKVTFEPGGLHVMLVELNADLVPGDSVSVTLQFENHGDLLVVAEVREP